MNCRESWRKYEAKIYRTANCPSVGRDIKMQVLHLKLAAAIVTCLVATNATITLETTMGILFDRKRI
jgi:hypothetical protein